jgi:hypothetical protein
MDLVMEKIHYCPSQQHVIFLIVNHLQAYGAAEDRKLGIPGEVSDAIAAIIFSIVQIYLVKLFRERITLTEHS